MSHVGHLAVSFLEHAAFTVVGFILMIVGLAMGVSLVLLPIGLVVGLIGCVMFIGGLLARIEPSNRPR
jgi:hypothetical protein